MKNQLIFISNCHAHIKTRCGRNWCLTMWARGISQIVPPNWSTAPNRVACATVSPLTYFCSPLLNSVLLFVTPFLEFKCRVFVRVLCIQRMALFLQCYTSLDCSYRGKNKSNFVKQILTKFSRQYVLLRSSHFLLYINVYRHYEKQDELTNT